MPRDQHLCRWSWQRFRCVPSTPPPPSTTVESFTAAAWLVGALALLVVLRALARLIFGRGRRAVGVTPEQLAAMLRGVELLNALGEPEILAAVRALEEKAFRAGDVIYRQDDQGDDCFFMVAGECYAEQQLHTFEQGTRVTHKRHGVCLLI